MGLAFAVLAAVPRLIRPDLAEYKLDESTAVLNGLAVIQQHLLPSQGQGSSVPGAAQGPLFYLFVAATLAVRPDARVVVLGIGLANALGVGLAYVVLARAFRPRLAAISCLLFATGPWAIVFSRKIWPNDLLAPLAVVALWGLFRALDPKTAVPGLGRTWLALAAMVSLNFGGWPLMAVPALAQVALPRTRQGAAARWSAAGLAVFLVSVVPRWRDLLAILHRLVGAGGPGAGLDPTPLSFIVQLAGPDAYQVLTGPAPTFAAEFPALAGLGTVVRWLVLLGAVVAVVRVGADWRRRGRPALTAPGLLLLWWLVPPIAALPHGQIAVYIHHFLGVYPAPFVLVALGLDTLAVAAAAVLGRAAPAPATALRAGGAATAAGLLAAFQLVMFAAYLPYVANHPTGTFFGVPLGQSLVAARQAQAAAATGPVIVLSDGDLVGVDQTPTVLASLTDSAPLRYVNDDTTVVFAGGAGARLLFAPGAWSALRPVLQPWQAPGGPLGLVRDLGAPGSYAVASVAPVGAWRPPGWRPAAGRLADGSALLGYRAPRQLTPGQPIEIDILWRIGQPAPAPQLQSMFVHLVDQQGKTWAAHDEAPLPWTSWHPGDVVLSRFALTLPANLPAGRYGIDLGRYIRPAIQPVPFLAADGRPGPSSVRLGPLAVPPPPPAVSTLHPARVSFGGQIALDGWQVQAADGTLTVGLLWRAEQPPAADYTVFVHLVGADGQLVAQHDGEPRDGQFPTGAWRAGDRVWDQRTLPLAGVPPGRYRLDVGLYTPADGKRLPVGPGDTYSLGTFSLP